MIQLNNSKTARDRPYVNRELIGITWASRISSSRSDVPHADGSKYKNGSVGAAVFFVIKKFNEELQFTLPPFASVYTAELYAPPTNYDLDKST